MDLLWHILDRGITHIFMSGSMYMLAWFACAWALRKDKKFFMTIVPALLACGFIGWREAWDVAHGDPLIKSFTDYASWLIGMALAIWSIKRYEGFKNASTDD